MPSSSKQKVSWLKIAYLLLAALVIYLLISQLSSFKGSVNDLKHSNGRDDLIVVSAVALTYFLSALTYYFLALKPIKYLRTVAVETGINTLNRLLPAGIGGIGANFVYFSRSRHTKSQAEAVVAANTIIGILANLALLAVLLIFFHLPKFRYSSLSPGLVLIGCGIVLAVVATIVLMPAWRRKLEHNLKITLRNIYHYRSRKLRLLSGFLCQVGLCLAFVGALSFSLRAVHGSLPLSSLMVAYSFGIWLGAIIPAPGGVGSVEAGLVTGLVAFKVDLTEAVATVLIFRLISFWLPLIVGTLPLFWSYRRGYL